MYWMQIIVIGLSPVLRSERLPAGETRMTLPLAYGEDLPVDLELPVSAEDDVKFFVGLVGVEEPDAAARCELLERHLGPGGLQIAAYEYFSRDLHARCQRQRVLVQLFGFSDRHGCEIRA